MDLDGDGDMHGGWIGVVAALALVHMVVRMDRFLAPKLPCKYEIVNQSFLDVQILPSKLTSF